VHLLLVSDNTVLEVCILLSVVYR